MSKFELNQEIFSKAGGVGVQFSAGQKIFTEGDPGSVMFILRDGEVEISSGGMALSTLWAGDMFGEMSMIDGSSRSATATAKSPVEAVAIDRNQFVELVRQEPEFAMYLLQLMSARVRELNCLI